eukprot:scaffold1561_cov404-Prasinococcus_capsulatus_cf.AAC.11
MSPIRVFLDLLEYSYSWSRFAYGVCSCGALARPWGVLDGLATGHGSALALLALAPLGQRGGASNAGGGTAQAGVPRLPSVYTNGRDSVRPRKAPAGSHPPLGPWKRGTARENRVVSSRF